MILYKKILTWIRGCFAYVIVLCCPMKYYFKKFKINIDGRKCGMTDRPTLLIVKLRLKKNNFKTFICCIFILFITIIFLNFKINILNFLFVYKINDIVDMINAKTINKSSNIFIYNNRFMITWMLHQILIHFNKMILADG